MAALKAAGERETLPWSRAELGLLGAVCALTVLVCAVLQTQGYSADDDVYGLMRTWQHIRQFGLYDASRTPGYAVPELVVGPLAVLGGPALACAVSAMLGIGTIVALALALRPLLGPGIVSTLAVLACNPIWLIAAATPMDYVYALFFLATAALALQRDQWMAALGLCILAAGSRLTAAPLGFALLSIGLPSRQRLAGLATYVVAGGAFYLPVFISWHATLDFLTAVAPPMTVATRAARVVYKLLLLVGTAGAAVLACGAIWAAARRHTLAGRLRAHPRLAVAALVLGAYQLALFVWLPLEIAYNLPILFALAVLACVVRVPRPLLGTTALAFLLYGAADLEWLRFDRSSNGPCQPRVTVGAQIAPHIAAGALLEDYRERGPLMACEMAQLPVAPPPGETRLPDPPSSAPDASGKRPPL